MDDVKALFGLIDKKNKRRLLGAVICCVLSVLCGILPYLGVWGIVTCFLNERTENLFQYVCLIAAAIILKHLLFGTGTKISHKVAYQTLGETRKKLFRKIARLPMLIVQDAVWGRVTANRSAGKSTRYYADEFHLLLKEEQTAAYSVEIWKRFRKWGGIPTALTQNVKDLLASPEVSNIFENSDFVYMLNQANGDRQILAKQLNISPHQLSYVTHSGEGEGLLFFGNVILPFVDHFPKDLELYRILTTKLNEISEGQK